MIDLSTAINEEFHRFTGYNEILSLTGGIVAFTSTIPIKRIGKLTGAEESMAKRTKKNGIAVFGKLYKWTDIEEIKVFINNNIIDSTTNTYREPFSSSLIYDLHRLIAELKDNNLAATQMYQKCGMYA